MSSNTALRLPASAAALTIFDRVLVAVEENPESHFATHQASVLAGSRGTVTAVAVADVALAAQAGIAASRAAAQIRADAAHALEATTAVVAPNEAIVLVGRPRESLLAQVAESRATLLAIGAGRHRRTTGLLIGALGSTLLRHCPCSILVARRDRDGAWPRRILVGVDGSAQSVEAVAIANAFAWIHRRSWMRGVRAPSQAGAGEHPQGASFGLTPNPYGDSDPRASAPRDTVDPGLARQVGSDIKVVAALGGKPVDVDRIRDQVPSVTIDARSPVDALVDPAHEADLIVVASQGRHGVGLLGSVSERVAHRASASVLVVRTAQRRDV